MASPSAIRCLTLRADSTEAQLTRADRGLAGGPDFVMDVLRVGTAKAAQQSNQPKKPRWKDWGRLDSDDDAGSAAAFGSCALSPERRR